MAVLRSLGSKYGLYFPQDPETSYYCDVIIDCYVDALDSAAGVTMPVLMKGGVADEEDCAKMKEVFYKTTVPLFKMLCANMKQHGGKYAAGNMLTIADCCMIAGIANIWYNEASPFFKTFDECFE